MIGGMMDGATIDAGMGTGAVPATPANVATEVARRKALGVPAMPADVAQPLRGALSAAAKGEGRMATHARGVIAARQAQQGARIRGALAAELGEAIEPIEAADAIATRAKAAAAPLYREAYAQPMVLTPEIEGIMRTPAFQEAMPQALRNIRNAQRDPVELGFRLDAAGNLSGTQTLTTEGFDQAIRAMKDSARAAAGVHPITGAPVHNSNSVSINARAKDLQGHLAAQNPAYGDAVGGYADEMAVRDALEKGADVAKLTGPEIEAQLRAMPPHALEAWTTGARTALADDATTAALRPGTNVAQRTRQSLGLSGAGLSVAAGDAAKQQAIETVAGQPGVLSRLDDRLEAENQAYQTFDGVRQVATLPDVGGGALEGITAAMAPVHKALLGRWAGAMGDLALRGNPRGTGAFRNTVDERTAGVLSATDSAAVQGALTAVKNRQASDRALRGALHSVATRVVRVGILPAAAQSADPYLSRDEEDDPTPILPLPLYGRR